ncbi:MAG: tetratricopeptide repeat protein [Desulfobaccales bacterium]|nr:tetratricopeptide repeat protein [Desulfobaccales bacterium]
MAKVVIRRRRGLEEPEEVLNLVQRWLAQLKTYWKWLLGGLVAVVVVLGAWGLTSHLKARQEGKAAAAWAQVRSKVTDSEANAEALKALEALIKDYPGTKAAQEAETVRAHLLYRMKNYAEAAKAYGSLLKGRDPGWDTLITESLSYCYEAMGDYKKAAEVLKPAAETTSGAFKSELYQRLGLLLEQAGERQEAATYWRKLLDQPPNPALIPYLKEKLATAEAAPKK